MIARQHSIELVSECGEYENDGIGQVDVGEMVYKYVNRDYIGTDCDVIKVSEKKMW